MSWSEFNSGNCYLMGQSIDNVFLQLWRHLNKKKRALNKMPCGKKENCRSWCPIRIYSFVMNWLLDPEPCYIFIKIVFWVDVYSIQLRLDSHQIIIIIIF